MKVARVISLAPFVLVGAALVPTSAAGATNPPTGGGCPTSYEQITVAAAEAAGYSPTPRNVDTMGNGDGIVCRKPYTEAARLGWCGATCPVPVVYVWIDNIYNDASRP